MDQMDGTYTMQDGTFYSVHSSMARSNGRRRRKSRSESKSDSRSNDRSTFLKKLKKRRLVFLDESPDYCRQNSTAGFPGKFTTCLL